MVRITHIETQSDFRLFLRFDDGVKGIANLSDLTGRGVFKLWNDPSTFHQAEITEVGAVAWPGDIDVRTPSISELLERNLARFSSCWASE